MRCGHHGTWGDDGAFGKPSFVVTNRARLFDAASTSFELEQTGAVATSNATHLTFQVVPTS